MSDQQPLLNPSNNVSINDDNNCRNKRQLSAHKYDLTNKKFQESNNEFIIFHSLFDWRQSLNRNNDDTTIQNDKDTTVGIFQIVSVFKMKSILIDLCYDLTSIRLLSWSSSLYISVVPSFFFFSFVLYGDISCCVICEADDILVRIIKGRLCSC
jgi:hypothetical protein